jgi:hypothetical protein
MKGRMLTPLLKYAAKPFNLMLCERGGIFDTLKVMDFGLVLDLVDQHEKDDAGGLTGTPLYLGDAAQAAAATPKLAAATQLDAIVLRIPDKFAQQCLARFALLLRVDGEPSASAYILQCTGLQAKRPAEHRLASSGARASRTLPGVHTGQLREAATPVRRAGVPKLLALWRPSSGIRARPVSQVSARVLCCLVL